MYIYIYIRNYHIYTTFGCSDSVYLLRPRPHFYIVLFLVIVYHKLPQILIFLLMSLWKDSWNLQALLREIWCIRPKPSPSTPWPQHLQKIVWRPFHTLPPFMTQWKMTLLSRNWLFRKHSHGVGDQKSNRDQKKIKIVIKKKSSATRLQEIQQFPQGSGSK